MELETISTEKWIDAILIQLAKKHNIPQDKMDAIIIDYTNLIDFLILKEWRIDQN